MCIIDPLPNQEQDHEKKLYLNICPKMHKVIGLAVYISCSIIVFR